MGLTSEKVDGDLQTFRPQLVKPRSVYIHIPFCRHRCGYCNFSVVANRDYLIGRFLNALESEIGWLSERFEIDTLFLGGGTPSHLTGKQLERLGEILGSKFTFAKNAEITAECNPNDLDTERCTAFERLGVNRISLGVQSLRADKLQRLDRDHTPSDVAAAIENAKSFSARVSMDLIFAAPDETLQQWESDLSDAIELQPDHMSTYELTYEKGTRFWNLQDRGDLVPSIEDLRAEMYVLAIEKLEHNRLKQYEVSSFSHSENECRHNIAYWIGDPYFAFGPGAARFVDGVRETNHQSTMRYLKMVESNISPVADREQLAPLDTAKERLAIGLRMTEGLDEDDFHQRTGFTIQAVIGDFADQLIENKMLSESEASGIWKLTRQGMLICDWISGEIIKS